MEQRKEKAAIKPTRDPYDDDEIAQKLLDKLIDSVSVGVLIDNVEENGEHVARNIEFKELSLVDDPACKDAKINPIGNGGTD